MTKKITIEVTPVLNPSLSPDPSGGDGLVWEVALSLPTQVSAGTPELRNGLLYISAETDIEFQFEEGSGLYFKDFRYNRSNLSMPQTYHHLGQWWNPGHGWTPRWPIYERPEFVGSSPSDEATTMTVTDRYTGGVHNVHYLYLLEYTYDGAPHVSDPKIKQSAPPLFPKDEY